MAHPKHSNLPSDNNDDEMDALWVSLGFSTDPPQDFHFLSVDLQTEAALDMEELEHAAKFLSSSLPPSRSNEDPYRKHQVVSSVTAPDRSGSGAVIFSNGLPEELLESLPALLRSIEVQLAQVEFESVSDFVSEGQNLSKLSSDMTQCDTALEQLESTLSLYATRLEKLAHEMRHLQEETAAAAVRVENRSASEAHLSSYLEELVIDPHMVRHLVDGDVGTEEYEALLKVLNKRLAFMNLEDTASSFSSKQMKPHLDHLLIKCVDKVRRFLHQKLALLKRPGTNVQIIKENVLLKHKYLFEFIQDHDTEAYREIRDDYQITLQNIYGAIFEKYIAGLMALKVEVAVRGETIVDNPSIMGMQAQQAAAGLMSYFSSKWEGKESVSVNANAAASVFSLGTRASALNIESPALLLALTEAKGEKIYYEEIHRSAAKMLAETCTAEHVFCAELFGEAPGTMFKSLFTAVIENMLRVVEVQATQTNDTIGILLVMKINDLLRLEMGKNRKIGDLNDYFVKCEIILKPCFKRLFDRQLQSLSQANAKELFRGQLDTTPHVITRRYSEFVTSIITISNVGPEDDTIKEGLKRLRAEFGSLLNQIVALYSKHKSRYVFLINNIDVILSVFAEKDIAGEDFSYFEDVLTSHIAAYVEYELIEHFADLIKFVRRIESPNASQAYNEAKVRSIVREFSSNWRVAIEHIKSNVMREFPNFRNGEEVLRRTLAQLLTYHKKCDAIVEKSFPSLKREMVATKSLMFEIRKHTQILED